MDTSWMLQRMREQKQERIWFLKSSLRNARTAATLLFLILFLIGGALLFYNAPRLPVYVQENENGWLAVTLFMIFFGFVALILTIMNWSAKKRAKNAAP